MNLSHPTAETEVATESAGRGPIQARSRQSGFQAGATASSGLWSEFALFRRAPGSAQVLCVLLASFWLLPLTARCQTDKKDGNASSPPAATEPAEENKGGAGRTFKNSVTGIFSPSQATVKIPFEGTEAEVLVKLSHFPANQRALDGIAALQTGQWDIAIAHFEAALQKKANNWSYHFALAVTQELKGNYAEAKKHYLEANRLKGGKEGYFDAQAGLKRIEARGQ